MKKLALLSILALGLNACAGGTDMNVNDYVAKNYVKYVEPMQSFDNLDRINEANNAVTSFKDIGPDRLLNVTNPNDGYELEVSVYYPENSKDEDRLPILLYQYAGGYILRGDYYNNAPLYKQLADENNAVVVVPCYRLSLEKPFPAQIEDNYAALSHVVENASSFRADKNNIIVIGNSAGGGLSASLAIYNKRHNNYNIKGQVLIYPMLDYKTGGKDFENLSPSVGAIAWDAKSNVFAWSKYIGNADLSNKETLSLISPVHADLKDLQGLPPAFIYTGDIDLFSAEDLEYAKKLILAGNKVDMTVVQGVYHVFDIIDPNSPQTKEFHRKLNIFIQDVFSGEK